MHFAVVGFEACFGWTGISDSPMMASGTMICLGLHTVTHDAAAAIAVDGRPVAFAQEERLSRVKGDGGFPAGAIDFCLNDAGISPPQIDRVVVAYRPWVGAISRLGYQLKRPKRGLRAGCRLLTRGRRNLGLGRMLGVSGIHAPVIRCDHHAAHARAVFAASPFARAAILVVDGVAEAWSGASFVAERREGIELQCLGRIRFPASLGLVYAAVTEHLGFRHNCEEGKVMAMAACGSDELIEAMRELCSLHNSRLRISSRAFDFGGRWTTPWFEDRFGRPRSPDEGFEERHFALARAVQSVVEDLTVVLAREAIASSGASDLCLTGGLALNPALNSAVATRSGADRLYMIPPGGDAGTALGAALEAGIDVDWRLESAFWGGQPSRTDVDAVAAAAGLTPSMVGSGVDARAAELLTTGAIGGICRGRSEFGPRALGHRSILADPRDPTMAGRINSTIKKRFDFQPFGCSALVAECPDLLPNVDHSPFMLRTYRIPESTRARLPAVCHVDGTSRIQTVSDGDGSDLAGILRCFAGHSGIPVLLNTSLNARGEPLAETAGDAITLFLEKRLDFLILEDRLFEQGAMSNAG